MPQRIDFGDIYGAPVVAKLEFGGMEKGNHDRQALVVRVEPDNQNRQLRSFLGYAETDAAYNPDESLYMVVMADQSTISGFATVKPSTQSGLLGRSRNNMSWYDAFGKPYAGDHQTEVIHNDAVSSSQLVVGFDKATGGLRLTGDKGTSGTVVTTVATAEQRKIVEKGDAERAKQSVPQRAGRVDSAKKRIAGLLRSGR
ncbi:MAG: hypothetical protein WDN66_01995 [Candidatus Saccharibacteria bacterium]